jgi:hypothetical protein
VEKEKEKEKGAYPWRENFSKINKYKIFDKN